MWPYRHDLPETQNSNVDVGREDLPEHGRPFKEDVGDVKRVEHPGPLRRTEAEGVLRSGGLCIADVTTVEIRQDIEAADNGQDTEVKLETID